MSDASDDENDFTEEQTEYTEGGEENDEIKKKKEKFMSAYATRKTVGEENEDEEESESEEENEGEENEDEDGSEGGEENEENDSTNEDAEDGEVAVSSGDIDIEIDGNTKEVVKKLTMKEKFNDMERKKILIISLIFSLIVSLPSGLGIGLGTAPVPPVPDYCSYPKFKPCRENGKCVMVSGLPTCECNSEWKGELCNMPSCENESACVQANSVPTKCTFQPDRGVKCHCKEGFTGQRCEDKTDLCQSSEYNGCNNQGTCSMVDGMPKCTCQEGWKGLTCEIEDVDYCSQAKFKTCRDNGKCEVENGIPTCTCDPEWKGELCKMPSCESGNACVDQNTDECSYQEDRGVICDCKEGFTGKRCEDETDLCQKGEYNGCNNHGTCSMVDGMPECLCDPGWTGLTCAGPSCTTSSNQDYCEDDGTASCDDSDGYAVCTCKSGYYGAQCEYQVNGNNYGMGK